MRKCETCGYLAFGGDVCKHCGAALDHEEPVAVAVGAGTTSADAPPPSPPPPPVPVAPVPVPPWARNAPTPPAADASALTSPFGAPPPPAPAFGRGAWTPAAPPSTPAPIRPKSSVGRRIKGALGALLAAAIGFGVLGALHHGDELPAGTQAFAAGHGVEYRSPDDTYTARFPSAPTPSQRRMPVGSTTATLNIAQVQTDDYEVVTASIVLPVSIPPNEVDSSLKTVLDSGAAAENAKIEKEQPVTIEGARGLRISAKGPDGYDVEMVAISSGSRVFLLGTHAKTGTERLYDALLRSFVMF